MPGRQRFPAQNTEPCLRRLLNGPDVNKCLMTKNVDKSVFRKAVLPGPSPSVFHSYVFPAGGPLEPPTGLR